MSSGQQEAFRRVLVNQPGELTRWVSLMADAPAIGLDVEMGQRILRLPDGTRRGRQILALIQIASSGLSLIVDPLAIKDLEPLRPLMTGKALKVVLGGNTDIQLLEEQQLHVRNIIDLGELGAAMFGRREEGMQALASRALDLEVDKSVRRANWMRRPLPPSLLDYAFRDAELTLNLYGWFEKHHHQEVLRHVRCELVPEPPPMLAPWIRRFLIKPRDVFVLLAEEGIDWEKAKPRLTCEVRAALDANLSPPQLRRVVRLAGDLALADLMPEIETLAASPSSVLRSSAARALGRMNNERARTVLQGLRNDEIEDVRVAAEAALETVPRAPKVRARRPRSREPETPESLNEAHPKGPRPAPTNLS